MTPCDRCPVPDDSPRPCHALATGHARLCALLAAGRDDYREIILRLTRDDPASPTLLEKAGNLARAVVDHVADGMRIAPPEVQAERERQCYSCEPRHDHARDACSACGCGTIGAASFVGVNLKLKRSWSSSACPDGRWGAEP